MSFYPAYSSGELTSSAQVVSGNSGGFLTSVLVITDGSNAATVIIYDNTSAAGKKLAEFVVPAATQYGGRNWTFPVKYGIGIYCSIAGTGASAIVEYI